MSQSFKGLRGNTLSQWEAIGQSLANIAPTATPAMGIPFILALSGNGSWLACLLALLAILCVAHQINIFAKRSSSPGSLYLYVDQSLGFSASLIAAWVLLIAYVGTAVAVVGGFIIYGHALTGSTAVPSVAATAGMALVACTLAGFLAYRDVHISARIMLIVEAISILLILILFLLPGTRSAIRWDSAQWHLQGATLKQVRSGLVLALFGFVGFESAASLGGEAVDALRTIPRAITLTAWVSGLFFILSAYAETIGFAGHAKDLAQSGAPLQLLAELRRLPGLAPFITVTTVCSFFACALACITAAARILYKLAEDRHIPAICGATHAEHRTPHVAIVAVSFVVLAVTVALAGCHVVPFDIYGWAGTFATYGFITAYFLVTIGSLAVQWRARSLTMFEVLSLAASITILSLAAASAFEESEGPYHWLPYLYLALLGCAVPLVVLRSRRRTVADTAEATLAEAKIPVVE